MVDLGLERLTKNISYEVAEEGIRLKIFGIPYFLSEKDLDWVVSFLMRLVERMKMIRKEKDDLGKTHHQSEHSP